MPENKIAAVPIFDSDRTESGRLFIPDQAKERCDQGIVKYCGPDVKWLKVGDYITFGGYTGTLMKLEDEGLLIIMPEDFVVAVIEGDDVSQNEVEGLYFRSRWDRDKAEGEIAKILFDYLDDNKFENSIDVAKSLASFLCANGVTPPSAIPYFKANFEQAMNIVADSFKESKWRRNLGIKHSKPSVDDYENLR